MKIFPTIHTINDVLPHIRDYDEIVVMEKDGYTVIDYVHMDTKTFTGNPETDLGCRMRRACRGLIFDADGKLISRPFHKFFNVGEREETLVENIDWTRQHTVMHKLDGSMIRPIFLDGTFRLGTRKGITDVGNMAENFVVDNPEFGYRELCEHLNLAGLTPIFEFHSLDNIVVIDYEGSFMRLLAVRDNHTGFYAERDFLDALCVEYNVPVVELFNVDLTEPNDFLSKVSKEKDSEGYVIRFDACQSTYKVKNDWYFQLHHVISGLNSERNIVRLLIDNEIDDILPKLPDNRRERIEDFAKGFWEVYNRFFNKVDKIWENVLKDVPEGSSRKDSAMRIIQEDKEIRPILFKFLDGVDDHHEVIKTMVRGKTNKDVVFSEFMKWFETQ